MTVASTSVDGTRSDATRALQIIESMPGHAWSADAGGRFTYVSPNALAYLGSAAGELSTPEGGDELGWRRVIHPDDYDRVAAAWRHCLQTGDPYEIEHRLRRADGVYRWFRNSGRATRDSQGRVTQWFGTTIDIDDQKRAEAALRDRERELSQLVDMVPSYLWRLSPDGEPTFFNKRLIDFFGLDIGDADQPDTTRLAAVIEAFAHPDDTAGLAEALHHSITTGQRLFMRYRLRRADGVYHWMEGRAEPLRDQDGRIVQWYGLTHDIDDQLRGEEALRESERSLRQLVETLPALIYCAAPDGKPIYRSQKLREFLGIGLDGKEGSGPFSLDDTLEAIIHPDDLAAVRERYAQSLSTGAPYALKHRMRRFDGTYRWVETRAAAMRDAEGTIVQWNGVCLDIEDQVRAQEALRRAQDNLARASQAASLAELSASIAHEVNQPLAAVVTNSHACRRWLAAEPPNLERARITAERITRDANAAADVVSRIRSLFKQSLGARTCARLGDAIFEARDLLVEEAARRSVRLEVEVDGDLPLVAFDRVQIQQVLINLVRNGMEAMEMAVGGRVLGVRVRRMEHEIRTEIRDSGPGIAFPDKIFEPFFTTKEHGMGMGLAICQSIVESHGGRLWAENGEPQGATFVFTLPVEAKAAS